MENPGGSGKRLGRNFVNDTFKALCEGHPVGHLRKAVETCSFEHLHDENINWNVADCTEVCRRLQHESVTAITKYVMRKAVHKWVSRAGVRKGLRKQVFASAFKIVIPS